MDRSPSIRSFSRARTTERGFALAMALIIAVLYFGLIELMLFDASRELAEARRFRARVVALTLAENGAESAAYLLVPREAAPPLPTINTSDWQGSITARRQMDNLTGDFTIKATGTSTGVVQVKATVDVIGNVDENKTLHIYYTQHSQ
jgi:hypothetical protein